MRGHPLGWEILPHTHIQFPAAPEEGGQYNAANHKCAFKGTGVELLLFKLWQILIRFRLPQ